MNERFRQLAEQAKIDYELLPEIAREPVWIALDDELEKFAELIVQECLKIVEPDRTSGDEWCVTLDETAYSIRQHFGVEE